MTKPILMEVDQLINETILNVTTFLMFLPRVVSPFACHSVITVVSQRMKCNLIYVISFNVQYEIISLHSHQSDGESEVAGFIYFQPTSH